MMHIGLRGTAVALTCAILAACGGGDGGSEGQRIAALSGRLDAIEKRLAKSDQTADAVEQLRNDAASLDRRLTSLETSLRELGGKIAAGGAAPATPPVAAAPVKPNAGRPPSGGHAAWGDEPTTRPDRSTRRAELRALSDEFRQKLADLRTQPGAMDPGSDRTREVLDWYRDQRRAILKGEGRTDQPAQ